MTDKEQEALKAVLKNLLKLPENKQCADCGASGMECSLTIFLERLYS